jgi:hypothetical protein
MASSSPKTEAMKKTLLDFTSSELASHSASLMGLALLFFTFIELFTRQDFLPRINFPTTFTLSWDTGRYLAFFVLSVLLSTGIFYLLAQLVFYGAYAHEIITLKGFSCMSIEELQGKIWKETTNKWFLRWFASGIAFRAIGFWVCIGLGIGSSVIMMLVLFLK